MGFDMKDMVASLPISKGALSWYLGELRGNKAFHNLRFETIALRECNSNGELLKECAENVVLVEAIPVKTEEDQRTFVLNCLKCNSTQDAIRKCVKNVRVPKQKILQSMISCIHTSAVAKLKLHSKIDEPAQDQSESDIDIQELIDQPHVSACYAGESYGLVRCDIA